MGWMSQAVVANQVIVEGANDGLFVYNGTPALGNLLVSIAAQAGTDAYGNTYPQDVAVGAAGGPQVKLLTSIALPVTVTMPGGGSPTDITAISNIQQVIELPTGNAGESSPATIGAVTITLAGGAGTAMGTLILSAAAKGAGGSTQGAFQLLISDPVGTSPDTPLVISGNYAITAGTVALSPTSYSGVSAGLYLKPTLTHATAWALADPANTSLLAPVQEGPHLITMDAGWSTIAGQAAPSYFMDTDMRLVLTGAASHATFTAATALNSANPLPANYRPNSDHWYRPVNSNPNYAGAKMGSNGVITVYPLSGGSTQVALDGEVVLT